MKKAILAVLVAVSLISLTGCVTETVFSPGYAYSPGYNNSYVSSTGYGVGDYGLGYGADYGLDTPGFGGGY